jgi:hypothetical protein
MAEMMRCLIQYGSYPGQPPPIKIPEPLTEIPGFSAPNFIPSYASLPPKPTSTIPSFNSTSDFKYPISNPYRTN